MFPHESLIVLAQKKSKQQVNPKNVVWRITQDSFLQFKNSFSLQKSVARFPALLSEYVLLLGQLE